MCLEMRFEADIALRRFNGLNAVISIGVIPGRRGSARRCGGVTHLAGVGHQVIMRFHKAGSRWRGTSERLATAVNLKCRE